MLAKEPAHPEALGAKGRLLAAQGRTKDALRYFEKATATSDPEPFIELAAAYLAAEEIGKARETAGEALRKSPGHPWAMAVLGAALVRDGQRAAGVEYLNRAFSAGPRRPIVWHSLADGFELANQPARAALCRKQAAALASSH